MVISRIIRLMAVVLGAVFALDVIYAVLESGTHLNSSHFPDTVRVLLIFLGIFCAVGVEVALFKWTGYGAVLGNHPHLKKKTTPANTWRSISFVRAAFSSLRVKMIAFFTLKKTLAIPRQKILRIECHPLSRRRRNSVKRNIKSLRRVNSSQSIR